MIYDYITTKPPLDEDTLAHYGIKGMKWKNHVYAVKKALTNGYGHARNRVLTMLPQLQNRLNAGMSTARKKASSTYKKGKGSYYKIKSKVQEVETKDVRRKLGLKDPRIVTEGARKKIYPTVTKYSVKNAYYGDLGKANSRSGQKGSRRVKTTRVRKRR